VLRSPRENLKVNVYKILPLALSGGQTAVRTFYIPLIVLYWMHVRRDWLAWACCYLWGEWRVMYWHEDNFCIL